MSVNASAAAVDWPAGHAPTGAAVHAVNTATSRAAPEAVWAWLVRPDHWGEHYANARGVRHLAGAWPDLALGSTFSWVTSGVRVTTEVTEFEPCERLGWTGRGLGARGHHAWLLTPTSGGGVEIRTEETQRGGVSTVLRPVIRRGMHRNHQRWVDDLARLAETDRRPPVRTAP